jgi:hypothetical protein
MTILEKNRNIFILLIISLFVINKAYSQVLINNNGGSYDIPSESAFLDASSYFDPTTSGSENAGKGLVFPRTNLTAFTFITSAGGYGTYFPTYFDGMIVYNTGTGSTPKSQGVTSTNVTPGFYYFQNLNSASTYDIAGGQWVRLNDNQTSTMPSGSSFPSSPQAGDVFYNTTTHTLYYYKDTEWVPITSTPNGTTLPATTGTNIGDLYYLTNSDVTQSVLKIFNGTAWVTVGVTLDSSGENYLSLTGQTLKALSVDLSGTNATGILAAARFPALTGDVTTTAGSLATLLSATGVTAGTYKSVTVDAKGRVTAGTNPTTLAGYGITDAASSTHNHTLDGLSNVSVTSKTNGDILQWNGSNWVNISLSSATAQTINFTPSATGDVTGSATGTTSLTPTLTIGTGKITNSMIKDGTIDLTTKVTGTLPMTNLPTTLTGISSINGLTLTSNTTGFSITGGTTPKTLTVTDNASISGTNTGDQTASTVSINTISGVTGSTVQSALESLVSQVTSNTSDISTKVTANSPITAATKTKITYDTKGLVTAGADATTADIAASTDKNYVTDAQLAILKNTSGTNTGDQTLSLSGSTLTISGTNGNSVTGIGDITSVIAGDGLTGGATSGDATLTIATNAIGATNLKGSSSTALDNGTSGYVLRSNGNGTFSWLDISSGVSADPSSLSLGSGQLFVGNSSGKAAATDKAEIPISGFKAAAASVDMGSQYINNVKDPTLAQDAATKNYVDTYFVPLSSKGANSGVVPLNSTGTIDTQYLPSSLVGAVTYMGTFVPGTTTIATASSSNKGYYYVASADGTYNSESYLTGDWIISDGTSWSKVSNHNTVSSVFGRVGAVVATSGDYTSDQVTEGTTNLYYTDARVNANSTVVALGTNKEDKSNKNTDGTLSSNSDTYYPSVKAVKTYVDAKVPSAASASDGYVLTIVSGSPTWQAVSGGGTVTSVSATGNSGIIASVADATTTPAITLSLGDITPTSVTTTGTISGGAITATSVTATGAISGSNIASGSTVSGSNTGDQQITLTGDVTGTGATKTTSIATTIADNTITSAKIVDATIASADLASQSVSTAKLKNISTTGTSGQVLTSDGTGGFAWGNSAATNLDYTTDATNGYINSSSGSSATIPAGSTSIPSLMLASDKTKLDGLSALSIASSTVLGGIKVGSGLSINSSTGVLTATNSGTITSVATNDGLSGGTVTSGAVTLGITTAGIAYSKLATIAAGTLLGNNGSTTASPSAIAATAISSMIGLGNVENTALSTWAGSNYITTLGTITDGTWNGSVIPITYGGTGASTATDAINNLLPSQTGNAGRVLQTDGSNNLSWATVGTGSVTSIGLSLPSSIFSVTNTPVTTSGTITATLATQSPNTVLAGPSSGTTSATPTFRQIVAADITGTLTQSTTGNAATATSSTNIGITNDIATTSTVFPTWVTANTGNLPLKVSSGNLYFVPSTGTLTATSFSGNLNATNLTSGTIPAARYGSTTIPVAAINASGTASSSTYLRGDGSWQAISSSSSSITGFSYAYSSGTTAALTIAGSTNYTANIPVLTTANTSSVAGLMVQTDHAKLLNIPTISGSPTTTGQALTYDSSSSTASWVQPGLTYAGTTGAGTVSMTNGSSSATIPVASSSVSGLMIPTDKSKLDTYPTISNTPTSGQVLASNGDGTATWTTSSGSGSSSSSEIYKITSTATAAAFNAVVKSSGTHVTISFVSDVYGMGAGFVIDVPSGTILESCQLNVTDKATLKAISSTTTEAPLALQIIHEAGNINTSTADLFVPSMDVVVLSTNINNLDNDYYYNQISGARDMAMQIYEVENGKMAYYITTSSIAQGVWGGTGPGFSLKIKF